MKRIILLVLSFLWVIPSVISHCPLCTAAAGTGVAAARFYGVDDSIIGVLLGGLIVSSALWFNKWLKKRLNFKLQEALVVLASFLLFAIPFYIGGLITNVEMVKLMPEHHSMLGLGVYGIDKLLIGMIIGSLVIWGMFSLSEYIKKRNQGVLFPYQGISFMMLALSVLSIIFWVLTR